MKVRPIHETEVKVPVGADGGPSNHTCREPDGFYLDPHIPVSRHQLSILSAHLTDSNLSGLHKSQKL